MNVFLNNKAQVYYAIGEYDKSFEIYKNLSN